MVSDRIKTIWSTFVQKGVLIRLSWRSVLQRKNRLRLCRVFGNWRDNFRESVILARDGLLQKKDGKGAKFENKTTTLELVGVILPYLLIPEKLVGQHIVMKVDNTACIFG
jgi:hypothetical protein